MSLSREDATRIIRFCQAGVGWGVARHEDDACVVQLARPGRLGPEGSTFAGATFDEALRRAAEAGAMSPTCLEKQIAFMAGPSTHGELGAYEGGHEATHGHPPGAFGEPLLPALTATVSALVHQTQLERGMSALYLTFAAARRSIDLRGQWRITDARRDDLAEFLRRHGALLSAPAMAQAKRAEDTLREMSGRRDAIEDLRVPPKVVIDGYSHTNDALLSVVLAALDPPEGDGAFGTQAAAWMALLFAKERKGMERAQLVTAFAHDRYDRGQHGVVAALIGSAESYLRMFTTLAPHAARRMLSLALRSEVAESVSAMEAIALARCSGRFGIDPTRWFADMSRKMDLLMNVEGALRTGVTLPADSYEPGP